MFHKNAWQKDVKLLQSPNHTPTRNRQKESKFKKRSINQIQTRAPSFTTMFNSCQSSNNCSRVKKRAPSTWTQADESKEQLCMMACGANQGKHPLRKHTRDWLSEVASQSSPGTRRVPLRLRCEGTRRSRRSWSVPCDRDRWGRPYPYLERERKRGCKNLWKYTMAQKAVKPFEVRYSTSTDANGRNTATMTIAGEYEVWYKRRWCLSKSDTVQLHMLTEEIRDNSAIAGKNFTFDFGK